MYNLSEVGPLIPFKYFRCYVGDQHATVVKSLLEFWNLKIWRRL